MEFAKVLFPVNNWILLKKEDDIKREQVGMLTVINTEKEAKQHIGTVVSVGKECDLPLEPGDTVIWGQWEGTNVLWYQTRYVAIRSTDVILIGKANN